MLTGLARPDAGSIHIGGIDCTKNPRAALELIGVVSEESNLYPELSGYNNLCFCASLYGMTKDFRQSRAKELLAAFNLTEAADRRFQTYSRGMKRRLSIAAGIIHSPKILFLDEPTTGIDVDNARQLRRIIKDLQKSGTTVFLTTHYIEEAERLCDRIAFIKSGQILRTDTVSNLIKPIQDKNVLQVSYSNIKVDPSAISELEFKDMSFTIVQEGLIKVESGEPVRIGPLVRFLEDNGIEITEVRKMKACLEDVFVRITGIDANIMYEEKKIGGKSQ